MSPSPSHVDSRLELYRALYCEFISDDCDISFCFLHVCNMMQAKSIEEGACALRDSSSRQHNHWRLLKRELLPLVLRDHAPHSDKQSDWLRNQDYEILYLRLVVKHEAHTNNGILTRATRRAQSRVPGEKCKAKALRCEQLTTNGARTSRSSRWLPWRSSSCATRT